MEINDKLLFFTQNILIYEKELKNYLWKHIKDNLNSRCALDDIMQNTMMKAWARLGQIREPENVRAWIYQIARNEALQYYRSLRRTESPMKEDDCFNIANLLVDTEESVPDIVIRNFEKADAAKVLKQLDPESQTMLHTYFEKETKVKKIAEMLGMKRSTYSAKVARAIQKYKEIYLNLYD